MTVYAAIFLVLVAVVLFWVSRRQRKSAGLPGGRIVYADTNRWGPVEKPLYSAEVGLTGKPDYLVEQDGQMIPVEVKSSSAGHAPYDGHIYQLAAYCLLVEHTFGKRPDYGLLHYAGKESRTFAIDYTPELENSVRELVREIQSLSLRKGVDRSHESPVRCARCGYRNVCDQALE